MKTEGKKRKSITSKKQKGQPRKAPKKHKTQTQAAAPPVPDPGSDVELDADDFDIFEEFGRRVDFLAGSELSLKSDSVPVSSSAKAGKAKKCQEKLKTDNAETGGASYGSEEDADGPGSDEEEYEREARSTDYAADKAASVELLPFKTRDGELVFDKSNSKPGRLALDSLVPGVSIIDDAADIAEEEGGDSSEDDDSKDAVDPSEPAGQGHAATNGRTEAVKGSRGKADARQTALLEAATYHSKAARREELSQQIATGASKLLEAPEEQLPSLRLLLELALDTDAVVQRLAVLSLSSVFKDILPGYRVRDLTDAEEGVQVTKAVQKLRDYERTLAKAFQSYVKLLRSMLSSKASSLNHKRVAVKCLRELLVSVPHFNHMHTVLQALVPAAAGGDARMRRDACAALEALLRSGRHGDVMLQAVQLVADLVRQRRCVCDPDVVRALLVLQFKDITKADVERGSKALARRYKFKKRRQREDAIAAALQEAAVAADADQARLQQSQMLEALFELFFRVLKRCTASGLLSEATGTPPDDATMRAKFPLLYVALEGLGKYTHLIGLEYFTDLIDVFQQLLASRSMPLALRMRCLLSTVDILQAQGDALNVDRKQIYMHLYSALAECPMESVSEAGGDAEASVETAWGAAAARGLAESEDSCAVLVAKAAARLLGWLKVGDSARLGAFVKRLCSSALHAEPGMAVALVSIASRTMRRHVKLHGMLEGECVGSYGSGGYDPHIADPAGARALSSTLWELCPLLSHFHPAVLQCATAAAAVGGSDDAASVEGVLHSLEPHALASWYSFRRSGLMCDVAAKPPGGGVPASRRKHKSGLSRTPPAAKDSPVVAALVSHCLGAADVAEECDVESAAGACLAGRELACMFRQRTEERKGRQKLRRLRVKLFSYAVELAGEQIQQSFPALPKAHAAQQNGTSDTKTPPRRIATGRVSKTKSKKSNSVRK